MWLRATAVACALHQRPALQGHIEEEGDSMSKKQKVTPDQAAHTHEEGAALEYRRA